ncbi:MAG: hypothetical protein H6Q73_65 [Firmicutes bacterium]|nr:hypothetical protein [Bacillota bacterium]
MHISKLNITGYKNCQFNSEIEFNKGLNILVGENGAGKTTIINSLRLILKENESSYMNINEDDFYRSLDNEKVAENIKIDVLFDGLKPAEEITFLTWCDNELRAQLHLEVCSIPNVKGYYKKEIWGGKSKSSIFEEETFECIDCIYLPPLRNAEDKLTNGRSSRLALLLKKQYGDNREKIVETVHEFNNKITNNVDEKYNEIALAKKNINDKLLESLGEKFGQSINLQFADITFNKIVESIKMVFFPNCFETDIKKFRDIAINSLGYNNLLYIATVFAELELLKENNLLTILLIEEPEAHLHPQLQVKFIQYIEQLSKSIENIQVIITTHSPVLASSVSVDNLIHIKESNGQIQATPLRSVNLASSKNYVNRWLDVTKSTLVFSRGIILVEGISETMLIPELAKICLAKYCATQSDLPGSLEEAGISVININGINFKHFMKFFASIDDSNSEVKLPIRCSGITDNDPEKATEYVEDKDGKKVEKKIEYYPISSDNPSGANSALKLIKDINQSKCGRMFNSPLKTFEYDLCMNRNTKIMAQVLQDIWPAKTGTINKKCGKIIELDNKYIYDEQLREDSKFIYEHIDRDEVGKGIFAQVLADTIKTLYDEKKLQIANDQSNLEEVNKSIPDIFNVPEYIENAIIWACGGEISE